MVKKQSRIIRLLALMMSATVLVLYARYEIGADSIKCGTPEILMLLESGAGKIAGRPTVGTTFGTSVLSSMGHFRVHYDTTYNTTYAPPLITGLP